MEEKKYIEINKKIRVDNILSFVGGAAAGAVVVAAIKTDEPEKIVSILARTAVTIAGYRMIRMIFIGK